ncbi:alpha-amylase family protein [Ohtaekwangia sp.]|uniref:alpha-amylase family protein n=1 Tax=Ohtaekwangia sp. TaxID=2066019 RepID=UPI002F937F61
MAKTIYMHWHEFIQAIMITESLKMRKIPVYNFALRLLILLLLWGCGNTHPDSKENQAVSPDQTAALWYKNAIIYTLDVEVFKDSDGDGVGDFKGLTSRIGYIDSLGTTVIWLAPFQPTPNRDDGYDISDYYGIDKRLGTLADFKDFLHAARERNIKVIMDLVVNHTSDKHPWFEDARKGKHTLHHNWYVWSDDRPSNYDKGMVFPGVQQSIWTFDASAHQYYYHRFYDFQPDLNMQNPAVKEEIKKVIRYWLHLGLDGFRLDGVPFFIEIPEKKGDRFEHQFELLTEMHLLVDSINPQAVILGEANVLPKESKDFFGKDGNGMHMMFNFFVNQHLFYALASEQGKPLEKSLEETKAIPTSCAWGQFLRNHDELDLGRLSNKERQQVYDSFGPDKNMQLYDRGIRRRLAPMLNNDRQHLELAYSLLLSLPSTPVLRYGDEIEMGDDLSLKERLSVRTPMQWNNTKNADFTTNRKPVLPVIDAGIYSYQHVNVAASKLDNNSLLNWLRRMIALRKKHPEIAYGNWKIIKTNAPEVIAMLYTWQGKQLLVVHNLDDAPKHIAINIDGKTMKDLLHQAVYTADNLSLIGHGYKWIEVSDRL